MTRTPSKERRSMKPLAIRKVADTSQGERVPRWNPDTGEKYLVNPATGMAEPWPLAGIEVADPPEVTAVSTSFVQRGRDEGWIVLEGERAVVRPAGPAAQPFAKTHVFVHADTLVIKAIGGDVRYTITENPDKWHDQPEGTDVAGDPSAEVRHVYQLALEG